MHVMAMGPAVVYQASSAEGVHGLRDGLRA